MGISKSNTPIWLKHNAEALHLSNSKGSKTDRMDVTKLPGNKPLDSKVNDQYLIALASDEIIEEGAGYTPFWKRQVAVKVGVVGEGTDTKIQYALLNRNSLIKRLSMDETTLDKYIEAGTVDEYIATRLEELSHIKSCFREANPTTGSKGEKQLRLDLAAQFPAKDTTTHIKDERNQYCVAMSGLKLSKENNYCAGWGEIAVKVGTTKVTEDNGKEVDVNQYAILNKNSLIQRLGYPRDYSGPKAGDKDYWEQLKEKEKAGTVDEYIKEIIGQKLEDQNTLSNFLIKLANGTKELVTYTVDVDGLEVSDNIFYNVSRIIRENFGGDLSRSLKDLLDRFKTIKSLSDITTPKATNSEATGVLDKVLNKLAAPYTPDSYLKVLNDVLTPDMKKLLARSLGKLPHELNKKEKELFNDSLSQLSTKLDEAETAARNEFLALLTPELWWTVPKEGLTKEQAAKFSPPAQIALKEPTTTADWDTEGKYTLTAAHDFIETSRINYDDLNKRGEIPMNCIFEPGTANEVSGWVIYKIEDLKRLGFKQEDLEKYTTQKENFLPALHKRLEVLRKENAPLDEEDINRFPIIE